jgi:hypothetical protein
MRAELREMMDERDKAREARMEAFEASIAKSLSKLDQIPTQSTQTWMIIAAAGGTVLLILGILQFARQEFFGASQFTASTYEQAHDAKALADKASKDVGEIKGGLYDTNKKHSLRNPQSQMSRGKYLSLEEARRSGAFKRFCEEHPSKADRARFLKLLTAMSQGALEGEETSAKDRAASSSGTRIRRDI